MTDPIPVRKYKVTVTVPADSYQNKRDIPGYEGLYAVTEDRELVEKAVPDSVIDNTTLNIIEGKRWVEGYNQCRQDTLNNLKEKK